MNAESQFLDEIADRLIVLFNKRRALVSDIEQRTRANVKDLAQLDQTDTLIAQYEAVLAPSEQEGIPA